ncbi:5-oxoprolinase subunit PxpB [Paenibacillus macerans]|uniref:5-oxoprolinase subunit PxpB n=1 Tax=Paenibacillus macerans TaxID=44252 RepID=UPI003D32412E
MTHLPSTVQIPIVPLGDSALVVKFGESIHEETHMRVRQLADYLEKHPMDWMIEFVPAFTSVTIYFDIMRLLSEGAAQGQAEQPQNAFRLASRLVESIILQLRDVSVPPARVIKIPVCYGGEWGPDLDIVAAHNGLSPQEVIDIHASADYLVYMLGFAPGFAYLGGMSERITTPRRQTPRLSIPAGTVSIAGDQTGVYPIDTPGGWQLIGKTPIELFKPRQMPPTLLEAGDIVRFYPISRKEFAAWGEEKR